MAILGHLPHIAISYNASALKAIVTAQMQTTIGYVKMIQKLTDLLLKTEEELLSDCQQVLH